MKAYQIKIILKNSKPPVWRRCLIPAGITFSQLALILEDIVESERCDGYEYEFYQAGIRVREWREGERQAATYYYDFQCASDTFIDSMADKEAWFTFRPGIGCEYRVEIEKRLSEAVSYPVIIKEKTGSQECGWRDADTVNRELEQRYPIQYGEPDYRTFEELREDVEHSDRGLTGACCPKDKTDRNNPSGKTVMQAFADIIMQRCTNELKEKLMEETERREEGGDADPNLLRSMLEDAAWQMKRDIMEEILGRDVQKEESRHPDIKGFLLEETKDTLGEMAEDLYLTRYKSLDKNSLAEKIRDEILKPEVMAKRMLLLSDAEIREFEKAMGKENGYYPDRKGMENLEKLYDLTYVMLYSDDYAEVPREAAEIYKTINTPAYQEERRGTYWLYHCLMMVDLLYACAPAAVVCRMMKKCLGRKVKRTELESLWENVPDELNPCVLRGDRVIVKETLRDKLYLSIEASQGEKKFYIPDPDEIVEYTENGYPVSDPYYSRLKTFFVEELDMDLDEVEEYMPVIWNRVSMGNPLADIMEMLDGQGIVFPSEKAMRKFVSLMTDINNHTRMLSNRGWTPNEMLRQMPAAPGGRKPTIVPMSSEAARMLGEAADELKERGFGVDLDYHADEITTMSMPDGISGKTVVGKKKVYPNDLCPCGSGKKYKKCCGRKN